MAVRFAELARSAQAQRSLAVVPVSFEPPASLEAGFLAEAARAQAAQQPRHDAVINEIHAGKPAAEVLGHDVTAATAAWLANRPPRTVAAAPAPRRPMHKWWPRFTVIIASAFFGGIATNLWLAQRADQSRVATALNGQACCRAAAVAPSPPAFSLQVPQVAQATRASKQIADARPVSPAPRANEPERDREHYAAAEKNAVSMAATAPAEALAQPVTRDQLREERKEIAAVASLRAASASEEPLAAAPKPAMSGALLAERSVRAAAAGAPVYAAAPAPMVAAKAAPGVNAQLRFALSADPRDAVQAWLTVTQDYAPRIYAAHPQAASVVAWAERFIQALPDDLRPSAVKIEIDSRLIDGVVRLQGP